MELEQEVKIIGADLEKIETYIKNNGGIYLGEENQVNILINSKSNPIKSDLGYFRIRITHFVERNEDEVELTFKERVKDDDLRKSKEHTVVIDKLSPMIETLRLLGYDSFEETKKNRRSYTFRGARFDFDTQKKTVLPYPYLEIEVKDKNKLDAILKELDIKDEYVSTLSIKDLIEKVKD